MDAHSFDHVYQKVSKWKQSNPGLQKRIERDFVAEAVEGRTVEDGQRQLTRKSELYELLKHGDSSQLTDAQRGELLFHVSYCGRVEHVPALTIAR